MQWLNAQMRWIAAGGVLLSGAGYAAVLTRAEPPVQTGPSPAHLRELASRVSEDGLPPVALSPVVLSSASTPIQPSRRPAAAKPRQMASRLNVPILPPGNGVTQVGVQRRPVQSVAARPARVAPAAPESPVKNIALMGVTYQDNRDVAWLVNLENQERDEVSVGEDGFGFQVKEIGPESVVLARGSDQFTVRLGDKQILVNEAPAVVASADTGGGGEGRRGRGQWGGGNAGGFGGRGGRGGFGQGGGRGNRGNWGGRSFASNSFGNSTPTVFGGGNSSGAGGGQRGVNRAANGGFSGRAGGGFSGRTGGGFGGGFTGRGGFGGGFQMGGGANNQFAANASGPTSNPQTARRRGGQLIGGATAIETPQAITNPQTQRRLGSASTGAAFGQSSPANGFGGNGRGGNARNNRAGGFQR